MRKSIAAGTLALASIAGIGAGITLSFPGISNAATTDTTTADTTTDPTTAGATTVRPDRGAIVTDTLAKLVTAGTITQDQADAVAAALAEAMPAKGEGRGGMRGGGGAHVETVATALGITADELRTALVAGQSIAQVAESKGVSVDTVKAVLKAEMESRLAQAVTDGKLTQAEADERLAGADAHIQAEIDRVGLPARGGRGGGRGGHMGEAPADAPADEAAASTSA